jgi:hypothetical protein
VAAVEQALSDPKEGSVNRRALTAELFHAPGQATTRAVQELYSLMELDPPECVTVAPRTQQTYSASHARSR